VAGVPPPAADAGRGAVRALVACRAEAGAGFDVPVLFVGVGEKMDDLLEFAPNDFVEALFAP
jgi:signal recognition particle GTPase